MNLESELLSQLLVISIASDYSECSDSKDFRGVCVRVHTRIPHTFMHILLFIVL